MLYPYITTHTRRGSIYRKYLVVYRVTSYARPGCTAWVLTAMPWKHWHSKDSPEDQSNALKYLESVELLAIIYSNDRVFAIIYFGWLVTSFETNIREGLVG